MPLSKLQISRLLLVQEIRVLLGSPALWAMLIILAMLTGFSFIQAVDLFSQASRTALSYPELASGMNPLEGIFVPTFGAYYLVETLLLPFVIIRLVGQDKQNGALKLLLQLPLSPFSLNAIKLAALTVVWGLIMAPAFSVFVIWRWLGGAVYLPEILTLILGHTLYSLTISCIAMFAAAICDSLPSAAMICLAATLGSWVLDFAGANGGWLAIPAAWSLTTLLRQFENGLLSSPAVAAFCGLSLLFFISASILIHPGKKTAAKIKIIFPAAAAVLIVVAGIISTPGYIDVSDNLKHSFNPADARALRQMNKPLKITIHLSRQDSRLYDLEHEVLAKLRRDVPRLEIIFADTRLSGLFSGTEDDNYGLIEYEYNGRHEKSYSNSPEEILPLLHKLAGHRVKPDIMPDYAGHPLVADASATGWCFYLVMPLLFLLMACLIRRSGS